MNKWKNNFDLQSIKAEDISDFSLLNKEGKKFLKIVLTSGEKIEIQIAYHIHELYNILSYEPKEVNNVLDEISQWMRIKKTYSKYKSKDISKLTELDSILKILDAKKKWMILPMTKVLWIPANDAEARYWRKDIITKEWIKNNLKYIEKIFTAFQNVAFGNDNPRPFSHYSDEEIHVLKQKLMHFEEQQSMTDEDKQKSRDESFEQNTIEKTTRSWLIHGIKEEINKVFGNRWREMNLYCKNNEPLSEETKKIVDLGEKIYKKLQLLGLYYRGKLSIKTKEWLKPFIGQEMINKSVDGMLYYKDHQEKYSDKNDWITFRNDLEKNKEEDVYIMMRDLKINDLSYGALDEVLSLLGKSDLAPQLYVILSSGLLPGLEGNHYSKEIDEK